MLVWQVPKSRNIRVTSIQGNGNYLLTEGKGSKARGEEMQVSLSQENCGFVELQGSSNKWFFD